jgi:hypothetical protein
MGWRTVTPDRDTPAIYTSSGQERSYSASHLGELQLLVWEPRRAQFLNQQPGFKRLKIAIYVNPTHAPKRAPLNTQLTFLRHFSRTTRG